MEDDLRSLVWRECAVLLEFLRSELGFGSQRLLFGKCLRPSAGCIHGMDGSSRTAGPEDSNGECCPGQTYVAGSVGGPVGHAGSFFIADFRLRVDFRQLRP